MKYIRKLRSNIFHVIHNGREYVRVDVTRNKKRYTKLLAFEHIPEDILGEAVALRDEFIRQNDVGFPVRNRFGILGFNLQINKTNNPVASIKLNSNGVDVNNTFGIQEMGIAASAQRISEYYTSLGRKVAPELIEKAILGFVRESGWLESYVNSLKTELAKWEPLL
jgi:hypothetical protein